ncbi:hypothetical protein AYR72_gp114 [Cnaphalocrocis medinalis granulovirus]|uniref:Uncharacterized protein n=2 Tax=Cnaphalocrocis medinalis granulovirus TaxID=1750712 RepID=A0A109WZY7_9BBAC|nr:hypothetical protein AYR72_gp114 [Cnaphalocrocis medinalis granulovirus]AMF83865.1 hypothetical protein [Cnaphalocrocis medinalis granulovirus]
MAESDSDSSTSQYNIGKTGTKRRRSSLTKIVSVFKKNKNKEDISTTTINSNIEFNNNNNNNNTTTATFLNDMNRNSQQSPLASTSGADYLPAEELPPQFKGNNLQYLSNNGFYLCAKIPQFNVTDLTILQNMLNSYFNSVLRDKDWVYDIVRYEGDIAVGFMYFLTRLYEFTNDNLIHFNMYKMIMYNMYREWCKYVACLYPLVENLNGANATKEIMNIINQSVYSVYKFAQRTKKITPIDRFDKIINDKPMDDSIAMYHTIFGIQAELTTLYTSAIKKLKETNLKLHNNEQITPTKDLTMNNVQFKLPYAPNSIKTTPMNFIVLRKQV